MPSHFLSPFKPKTPVILTTPAPQFVSNDNSPPSTTNLAPDSSKAYLRPPHPTYPHKVASPPLPRPRSATFRSSPLAGSVISSDSLAEAAMDDEKRRRRVQSMREVSGTVRDGSLDSFERPKAANTGDPNTQLRLRFSEALETRETLSARPSLAPPSSRRPLSDLSILRPTDNAQEANARPKSAAPPMSAEGLWRDSMEIPVFSRKLIKSQNVVMPVKASASGPSRLRKHLSTSSPRVDSETRQEPSADEQIGITRSKSEGNLRSARPTRSSTKLVRFRRAPSFGGTVDASELRTSHPSSGASGLSSTTRKLKKLRSCIAIPISIREEDCNGEASSTQALAERTTDVPSSSVVMVDHPPGLPAISGSHPPDKCLSGDRASEASFGSDSSSVDRMENERAIRSLCPSKLPEIDAHSQVFSWFGSRSPGSRSTPSSPTLSALVNSLIPPPEIHLDSASLLDSPHGSTTESLSEFAYGASTSGRSTPYTAPGTPCLSTKGSLSSLRDLIAHIDATEIGKAISFYASDDSDTRTAQRASLRHTLSEGSTIKEHRFIDVVSPGPLTKNDITTKPKDARLNLRRCTRLFPHPRPRPLPTSSFMLSDHPKDDLSRHNVVKRRKSFFERMIPCLNRSSTTSSLQGNGVSEK